MSDYDKAANIITRLELIICHGLNVTPEQLIAKCKSPEELNFYYRKVCRIDSKTGKP